MDCELNSIFNVKKKFRSQKHPKVLSNNAFKNSNQREDMHNCYYTELWCSKLHEKKIFNKIACHTGFKFSICYGNF